MPNKSAYDTAMESFKKSASSIKPPESDPIAWNLNNGLWHLAQAIQRDMEEMKKRLDAIDNIVKRMK
jgi:hypothetical protein